MAGMKFGAAVSSGRLGLGVQRGVEPGVLGPGGQRAAQGSEELDSDLEGLGSWRVAGSAEQDIAPLRPAQVAQSQLVLGLGGQREARGPSCGARAGDAGPGVLGLGGREVSAGPGAHGPGAQRSLPARPRPRNPVRVRVRVRGSARPGSPPPKPGPVLGCGAQAGRGGLGAAPRPPSGRCRPGAFVSAEAASPPRAGGAQRSAAQGARLLPAGRGRRPQAAALSPAEPGGARLSPASARSPEASAASQTFQSRPAARPAWAPSSAGRTPGTERRTRRIRRRTQRRRGRRIKDTGFPRPGGEPCAAVGNVSGTGQGAHRAEES